ncbi:MAG: hypothetical protein ABIA12_01915 [Candidatus Aenigmatarchaeota archaeon]
MENLFTTVISKMVDVGMYDLLIFVFALALFYAVLKRAKILGESTVINGTIAFVISFFIFGYPVIVGYSLVTPFASFFTQTTVFIMVFLVAFLMASFFYPDLPEFLTKSFSSRGMLMNTIAIGIAIAVISGAVSVLWNFPKGSEGMPSVPAEVPIMTAGVVVAILLLIVASSVVVTKS